MNTTTLYNKVASFVRLRNSRGAPKQFFESGTFTSKADLEAYVNYIIKSGGFLGHHTVHVYPDNTLFVTLLWE